mmetsp:Transcript_75268/g.176642  ORF Transcript_75268/g.176642 Transcript_75268/m.176642 type:complete len:219 (-) Transcript_75268:45-701(-)
MDLPSSTAATIVEKLSSARTMSADSLATSVPVIPIAMPMSACLRAGASLTPSPVIATISPSCFRIFTISCLCFGSVLENTAPSTSFCAMMCCKTFTLSLSDKFSKSFPVKDLWTSVSVPARIPSFRAMASAVPLLSPVIIITLMPAVRHSWMASKHSGRGGSMIPTSPTKVRSVSTWMKLAGSRRSCEERRSSELDRCAKARVRRASEAKAAKLLRIA